MATFGNSAAGIAIYPWKLANTISCGKYALAQAGVVSKLTVALCNVASGNQACHVKGLIYDDDGAAAAPGTLMGLSSAAEVLQNASWGMYDCVFNPAIDLTLGDWHLAVMADQYATGLETMYSAASGGAFTGIIDAYADGPSNPAEAADYTDATKMYVVATYTLPVYRSKLVRGSAPMGPHGYKRRASTAPQKRYNTTT